MSKHLSPAELEQITKKKRAASQAAVLARMGIPFRFLGRSIELSREVADAFALTPPPSGSGVDWSKVR